MKIACLVPGGLGGTQKAGWLFAKGLAHFGHSVTVFSQAGPFVPNTPVAGLSVETSANEQSSFPAIADGKFDALHIHMPGYYIRHPIYPFLKNLGKSRPRVVETNVFGWLQDWRANPVTDYRLFISMTGACQAAQRAGKQLSALRNCNVARYPVEPARLFSTEKRIQIRSELGLDETVVLAIRLGRPDAAKWTDWECSVTKMVQQTDENHFKLLVMEPPSDLKARIIAGQFGNGIHVHDVEVSPERVSTLINACDIVFHAARFGESFGYAIAEGMAAGKPVVTRTTPWGDNAQVELVEHGESGFVCCSREGALGALQKLISDKTRRDNMGMAAKERILSLGNLESECAILEAALLDNRKILDSRWDEVLGFARSFPAREWSVIEKIRPDWIPNSENILHREMCQSRIRQLKKYFSSVRANLRSLVGRRAYK